MLGGLLSARGMVIRSFRVIISLPAHETKSTTFRKTGPDHVDRGVAKTEGQIHLQHGPVHRAYERCPRGHRSLHDGDVDHPQEIMVELQEGFSNQQATQKKSTKRSWPTQTELVKMVLGDTGFRMIILFEGRDVAGKGGSTVDGAPEPGGRW